MATSKRRSGQVRIIGGSWRGSRLPVLCAPGLRPTHDRIRETVFNWLSERIGGARCLDLYAGTGALGFEAASRGAASVTLVDANPKITASLRSTARKLVGPPLEIVEARAHDWLQRQAGCGPAFDIIFLDPPYSQTDHAALFGLLETRAILRPAGYVYFECERNAAIWQQLQSWDLIRDRQTKTLRYALLRQVSRVS